MNARLFHIGRWLVLRPSRRVPGGDEPLSTPLAAATIDFDALAQGLAEGMPRREMLRRLCLGLAGACLAALGLAPVAHAATCPPGIFCFGVCVDPQNDPKHCGGCGRACNATHLCCNGVCKNPSNDPRNCGGCGTVCAAGQFCCSGTCINLKSDPNHCGACLQRCLPGQSCVNGVCLCPAGQVLCYGRCTDRATDENHCGGCGVRCAATQVCQNGRCLPCPSGSTVCGGPSVRICCPSTHPTCCNGICCPAGRFCCDNQCSVCPCDQTLCTGSQGTNCCTDSETCCDGACNNLQTDVNNCGACGTPCPTGRNCSGGRCTCSLGVPCGAGCCTTFLTNNACLNEVCTACPANLEPCGDRCCPEELPLCKSIDIFTGVGQCGCPAFSFPCGAGCCGGLFGLSACVNEICITCPTNQPACRDRCCPEGTVCTGSINGVGQCV